MHVSREHDRVVNQGWFGDGSTRVEYYTTSPSPSQWAAIGIVLQHDDCGAHRRPRRMLVGKGPDEAAAVADLRQRVTDVCNPPTEHDPGRAPVLTASVQDRSQAEQSPLPNPLTSDTGTEPDADVPTP